jgi:hypothetical protein
MQIVLDFYFFNHVKPPSASGPSQITGAPVLHETIPTYEEEVGCFDLKQRVHPGTGRVLRRLAQIGV